MHFCTLSPSSKRLFIRFPRKLYRNQFFEDTNMSRITAFNQIGTVFFFNLIHLLVKYAIPPNRINVDGSDVTTPHMQQIYMTPNTKQKSAVLQERKGQKRHLMLLCERHQSISPLYTFSSIRMTPTLASRLCIQMIKIQVDDSGTLFGLFDAFL